MPTPQIIPVVSLFSGPGGMDLGFREQGFEPVIAIDKEQSAVDTYNHNHPRGVAMQGDLSTLSGLDVVKMVRQRSPNARPRGVIGGPPCQYYSHSNVQKRNDDPRRLLPLRYAQILHALNEEFNIDFFVFENVPGLKSKKHTQDYAEIRQALERAGFNLFDMVLDSVWFGVAQKRRRLMVVGINKELHPDLVFQFPPGDVLSTTTVKEVIANLPAPTFYKRDLQAKDIPHHPNHWTMNPRSPKFTNGTVNKKGRSFRRLEWDQPSQTVAYGNREIHIHPDGNRRLSIYEAMRLQGFPEDYELKGTLTDQVTQISDAVPPPLANAVAAAIRSAVYDPIEQIQNRLLLWWEQNQRHFPWRQTKDPYEVLVAEKLLQQTAARQEVVNAYMHIVQTYPGVESLAKATAEELKPVVQPLGFTYRARELPKLARALREKHEGKIPDDLDLLKNLPGVGDYAARAVLSFAYGRDVPIVDTNVARFLYRFYGVQGEMHSNPARNRRLINLAESLVPKGRSRDFNLAILDLCASICKPHDPLCAVCPLQLSCTYGRLQAQNAIS